jgi:RNA recognition motif-containing protein
MNLYIGNLSFNATEEQLREAFEGFGAVSTVNIIKDKFSGESRGFAFVEMPTKSEAIAAMNGLNGKEMGDRQLNVNEAKPREANSNRGGGGGGRDGGGRRGY